MQNVDTIACVNNGGYIMKFRVTWQGGDSGWSGEFANPNSESINLNNYNIPAGTLVGIEVDVALGENKNSSPSQQVAFAPNSNSTATYQATGGARNVGIHLEGQSDALEATSGAVQVAGA